MPFDTYTEFQQAPVSEKVTMAVIEARKRLLGWAVYSGSVYRIAMDAQRIVAIEDEGTAYVEESSTTLAAGEYYHDRENGYLYLRASDDSNPNSRFLVMAENLYFSNIGLSAPYDHGTWSGYEVDWREGLEKTPQFGVEIDSENQIGEALDGSGSLTFKNEQAYWKPIFEKKSFNNSAAHAYSWSPSLPFTQAKLLYRGKVSGKSYNESTISFKLVDRLAELRAPLPLSRISDIVGALVTPKLLEAFQRRIYGEAKGIKPTCIDMVSAETGYPLTGTVSLSSGTRNLTGTGTAFLSKLSPGDEIYLAGVTNPVTIETVESDVAATLSEEAVVSVSDVAATFKPERPSRHTHRDWVLSGHALREPATTVADVGNNLPGLLKLTDTTDFEAGAEILIGDEVSEVRRVSSNSRIRLETNLELVPAAGTVVKRLSVTNVRLGTRLLTYSRDYTYDASTGRMALDALAEFNVAPTKVLVGTIEFTLDSRTVTGTNTVFTSQLKPGDWVRPRSQSTWYEVLQVVSDTELHLRLVSAYTQAAEGGLYRSPEIYNPDEVVLSCDVLGCTEDGTSSGTWVKTAAQVVKHLLTDAGLSDDIEESTFTEAAILAPQRIGFVIPETFESNRAPTYRDVVNLVNKSVFGALIQTPDFKYEYHVLRPRRVSSDALRLDEVDALDWSVSSQIEKIVKTVRVEYLAKEYDWESADTSNEFAVYTNRVANYVAKATKEYVHKSVLINEEDAETLAQRLAFLFSTAYTTITVETKMQAARSKIADVVDFTHEKLYERTAGTSRKVGAVRSSKRSGEGSTLEIEDLANAFTQCGTITEDDATAWSDSGDDEKTFSGFITDDYGMQDNDADTHGVNRIW